MDGGYIDKASRRMRGMEEWKDEKDVESRRIQEEGQWQVWDGSWSLELRVQLVDTYARIDFDDAFRLVISQSTRERCRRSELKLENIEGSSGFPPLAWLSSFLLRSESQLKAFHRPSNTKTELRWGC